MAKIIGPGVAKPRQTIYCTPPACSNKRGRIFMLTRIATLLASAIFLLISTTEVFGAADCDRACLRSTLDQYLNAVMKHDPNAAPLFIGFRQTENATVVKLGTGLWKTATALGKVQRRFVDPISGQAAYFGL